MFGGDIMLLRVIAHARRCPQAQLGEGIISFAFFLVDGKEVLPMVTWSELFMFVTVLTGIAALFYGIGKKK
ncbi:MAG: hypothetical protein VZR32_01790 [Candidatus Weimeria sp.]|nr:hypothetical protein [Candidatus Weimeria sp.]